MSFDEMGLRPELLRAIGDLGYERPTPIQARGIPAGLSGIDVLGCARTGTGKTAAFLLPVLERLTSRRPGASGKGPRALVVTPTRELAAQVGESARLLGKYLKVRVAVVFGGVGLEPQTGALRRGIDLLVATPGRMLDHLERRNLSLADVEVLVLDEADRMLDMGFLPAVRRILAALPPRRQNLLFSATMPEEVEDLIRRTLREPTVIEVSPRATTAPAVRQVQHPVPADRKRDLLSHLLSRGSMGQVLVFTRTKVRANRLARHLERTGRRVAAIHGDKSQGARTAALEGFRSGRIDTLVATDLAARGLDVDGISHVVNFDLPHVPEDYVHRIGRTARAGAAGDAVSLVAPEEAAQVRAIEKLIGAAIPSESVTGFASASSPAAPAPVRARASLGARSRFEALRPRSWHGARAEQPAAGPPPWRKRTLRPAGVPAPPAGRRTGGGRRRRG